MGFLIEVFTIYSLETAKEGGGISFCINVYHLSAGGSNNTKETNWSLCQVLYHRW